MNRKYTGLDVPYNLRAFNEMYRAAEREFYRTGVWKLVDPDKKTDVAVETREAALVGQLVVANSLENV